jgi:hypothetical protein
MEYFGLETSETVNAWENHAFEIADAVTFIEAPLRSKFDAM